jgi:hypothetical protein
MFLRTQVKGATSELINLSTAVCITHRKWHDSDHYTVAASFTPERVVQDTLILTRPMSLEETETVIEMITGALQAELPLLDLREFGDHSGHDVHKSHAVHHSGAR